MPPIDNVDTLPGVNVDVADGQLRVRRPLPGPKFTILGTTTSLALDEHEPVSITNVPSDMQRLRHIDGSPSELSMAVAEAVAVGAVNIEVIKIATVSGEYPNLYTPNQRFDDLEEAFDVLKLHDVDVVCPVNAYIDSTGLSSTSPLGISRSTGFHRQLADFCWQATREWNSCIGTIGARPLNRVARNESWAGAPSTDAEEWFDDPSLAHLREWVNHLRAEAGTLVNHSAETWLAGYLAGSDETSYGQISGTYDGWARDANGNTMVDRNNVNVDGGARIRVCTMLGRIRTDETQKLANIALRPAEVNQFLMSTGAVAYGALLTKLAPEESTTGRAIPGVSPSRAMPGSLAESLLQARFITLVDRSGDFVVSKGITGAYNGGLYTRSDFTMDTTVRILDAAIDVIRDRSKRYIGRPINQPNLAAMQADITSGIDAMKPSGAIQRYRLFVKASADQQVLGECSVEFAAVIGYELAKVNAFTQLQRPDQIG